MFPLRCGSPDRRPAYRTPDFADARLAAGKTHGHNTRKIFLFNFRPDLVPVPLDTIPRRVAQPLARPHSVPLPRRRGHEHGHGPGNGANLCTVVQSVHACVKHPTHLVAGRPGLVVPCSSNVVIGQMLAPQQLCMAHSGAIRRRRCRGWRDSRAAITTGAPAPATTEASLS